MSKEALIMSHPKHKMYNHEDIVYKNGESLEFDDGLEAQQFGKRENN
jgi:hypothetical protein